MGVLIAEERRPSIFDDAPAEEAAAPESDADEAQPQPPPRDPPSPPPRLVPITRRRK